mmetsp:Transcript_90528/g.198350  ORF Transcript_90528/g.198350 Transcript_90528/m.198350 type:complete len:954 (+) Transcript_90528:106-2967(+)
MDYQQWHQKWKDVPDELESRPQPIGFQGSPMVKAVLDQVYTQEVGVPLSCRPTPSEDPTAQSALLSYERNRPREEVMHHYRVEGAGDTAANGEYFPTGDFRNEVPVYQNRQGVVLTREKHPEDEGSEEKYGWVLGYVRERRPLYGVQSEDCSAPSLGWSLFTAPAPAPVLRYFSEALAAKEFKDKGTCAFQEQDFAAAEKWYTCSLECKLSRDDYKEAVSMVLSNRAEARLRLAQFEPAAHDARSATELLKTCESYIEPLELLRQKTGLRLAKALSGLQKFDEAYEVLSEMRRRYPRNRDIAKTLDEISLSWQVQQGHVDVGLPMGMGMGGDDHQQLLACAQKLIEELMSQVADAGKMEDLPEALFVLVRRLHHIFQRLAELQLQLQQQQQQPVGGGEESLPFSLFQTLQTFFRRGGGLALCLRLLESVWTSLASSSSSTASGSSSSFSPSCSSSCRTPCLDLYKHPTLELLALLIALACQDSSESGRLVAASPKSSLALLASLGGCSIKVASSTCEALIALVNQLWKSQGSGTLAQQEGLEVLEKAAHFLGEVCLEAVPADAPAVSAASRAMAHQLCFDFIAAGGRNEFAALRGLGTVVDRLLLSDAQLSRSLGILLLKRYSAEPSALPKPESLELLLLALGKLLEEAAAQAVSGETQRQSFPEYGSAATLIFADFSEFACSEDGATVAVLLEAISKVVSLRLAPRSQKRSTFEAALLQGRGPFLLLPLLQAPLSFSEPAARCLAMLSDDVVAELVALGVVAVLLGVHPQQQLLSPGSARQQLCPLWLSAPGRAAAAQLLSRTIEFQAAIDSIEETPERALTSICHLAMEVFRHDTSMSSEGSTNPLQNMVHVLLVLSKFATGSLCRFLPEELLAPLAQISATSSDVVAIIDVLKKERRLRRAVKSLSAMSACSSRRPVELGAEDDEAEDEEMALQFHRAPVPGGSTPLCAR